MAEATQFQRLDFKHPRLPRKTKWHALSKWHQRCCLLIMEAWNNLLSHPIQVTPGRIQPLQYRAAVHHLPDDSVGVRLSVGPQRFPSLVVISKRQLHGLLADLLNLEATEWPAVRRFSPAEDSLMELLHVRIAEAVAEAMPGPEATTCNCLGVIDKPDRTRLFSETDELFVCDLAMKSRFGTENACWLLPRRDTEQLVGADPQESETEERARNPALEVLANRIPVEIVVELGQCGITMAQVADLAVGDLLVLDQPIHRPLAASVSGERKWSGHPVRVGQRQGFEVTSLLNK